MREEDPRQQAWRDLQWHANLGVLAWARWASGHLAAWVGAPLALSPAAPPNSFEPPPPMPSAREVAEWQRASALAWAPLLRIWPNLVALAAQGDALAGAELMRLVDGPLQAWAKGAAFRWEEPPGTRLQWDEARHEGLPEGQAGGWVEVVVPGALLGDERLWRAAVRPSLDASP